MEMRVSKFYLNKSEKRWNQCKIHGIPHLIEEKWWRY